MNYAEISPVITKSSVLDESAKKNRPISNPLISRLSHVKTVSDIDRCDVALEAGTGQTTRLEYRMDMESGDLWKTCHARDFRRTEAMFAMEVALLVISLARKEKFLKNGSKKRYTQRKESKSINNRKETKYSRHSARPQQEPRRWVKFGIDFMEPTWFGSSDVPVFDSLGFFRNALNFVQGVPWQLFSTYSPHVARDVEMANAQVAWTEKEEKVVWFSIHWPIADEDEVCRDGFSSADVKVEKPFWETLFYQNGVRDENISNASQHDFRQLTQMNNVTSFENFRSWAVNRCRELKHRLSKDEEADFYLNSTADYINSTVSSTSISSVTDATDFPTLSSMWSEDKGRESDLNKINDNPNYCEQLDEKVAADLEPESMASIMPLGMSTSRNRAWALSLKENEAAAKAGREPRLLFTARGTVCPPEKLEKKSLAEQLKYKYLLLLRGRGCSPREMWVWRSNSLPFLVDSPVTCYYDLFFKPWQHYIPIKADFSDLFEKLEFAKKNDERFEKAVYDKMDLAEVVLDQNNMYLYLDSVLEKMAEFMKPPDG